MVAVSLDLTWQILVQFAFPFKNTISKEATKSLSLSSLVPWVDIIRLSIASMATTYSLEFHLSPKEKGAISMYRHTDRQVDDVEFEFKSEMIMSHFGEIKQ